jgi:hypothetical protein
MINVLVIVLVGIICFVLGVISGALLFRQRKSDYDGSMIFDPAKPNVIFQLEIERDPELLKNQKSMLLAIKRETIS